MWVETASYIFRRKTLITESKETLAYVDSVIKQEHQLHQHEVVCFLHDCYRKAVNKVLKLHRGQSAISTTITKSRKDYPRYVALIPLITANKINPFSFFSFIVEQRRKKYIPCTVANVATLKAVNHYLDHRQKNTYKVSTYTNFKHYEETLYNQLMIDLVSMTTYLLRKANVALNANDTFLFSTPTRVMIALSGNQVSKLTEKEQVLYEDLQFDPQLCSSITTRWNKLIDIQVTKITSMHHDLQEQSFRNKLQQIAALLSVLKVK